MIRIQDFSIQYSDFNFSIPYLQLPSTGLILIHGANGSGKTSLLLSITGFNKSYQGNIYLKNINIKELSHTNIIQQISFLPQISTILPPISGLEFVQQGLYLKGEDQTAFLIEQLQISHLLSKDCHTMSGGEKQLLSFVRNLAIKKSIIILDEPDSFLTKSNRQKIIDLITMLSHSHLVLFSSHQYELFSPTLFLEIKEITDYHFQIIPK